MVSWPPFETASGSCRGDARGAAPLVGACSTSNRSIRRRRTRCSCAAIAADRSSSEAATERTLPRMGLWFRSAVVSVAVRGMPHR